jgi:hypothetical protein
VRRYRGIKFLFGRGYFEVLDINGEMLYKELVLYFWSSGERPELERKIWKNETYTHIYVSLYVF